MSATKCSQVLVLSFLSYRIRHYEETNKAEQAKRSKKEQYNDCTRYGFAECEGDKAENTGTC